MRIHAHPARRVVHRPAERPEWALGRTTPLPMLRRALPAAPLLAPYLLTRPAHAQAFPGRPVRIVPPYPPGGGADSVARLLRPHLAATLNPPPCRSRTGPAPAAQPDVRARFDAIGIVAVGSGPAEFGKFVAEQRERAALPLREASITLG